MIKPVGSDLLQSCFVDDPQERRAYREEAEQLPSIVISSQAAANAVMLGAGYFSPLPGFMNLADALSSAQQMTLTNGSFSRSLSCVWSTVLMPCKVPPASLCVTRTKRVTPY